MPYLTRNAKGIVYLSWIDYLAKGHALRYSRWNGKTWSKPETIASGRNWFINWADFPSIAVLADGSLWAHWLARSSGGGTYGYGIKVARRNAQGNWREVHGINLEDKQDYAGFLSFAPETPAAFYLSPPAAPGHHSNHGQGESDHRKTARYIEFLPTGPAASDLEVDADVCSCCQTALARTEKGLIAAYRDHLPGEIRDISVIRRVDGAWTSPKTLSPDGWKINGCPTEGPSIASHGAELAIAWLTRADDRPLIQLSRSTDSGEHFTAPVRIDDGNPIGRPSLTPFREGSYLAVWLEKKDDQTVDIRLRKLGRDGHIGRSVTAGSAPGGRAAGVPKIAVTNEQIIVVWRDQHVRAEALPAGLFDNKVLAQSGGQD
jgi:hypothetical protein